MKSVQHLSIISVRDEYGTPKTLFLLACFDYTINPKLDVCATNINKKCERYFTKEIDALKQDWDQDFFMNPPYSQVSEFMRYAYKQHKKHNVNALILTYAKTDTKFWHNYVEGIAEVHFIKGRIKFLDEFGNLTKNTAPYPSVWIIFRKMIN